jgi:putative FmdB family regulatory protein
VPIYEYQCRSCGRIIEALQKFSDPPLSDCPHCRGGLHKLISHTTFHLKGTGWYVTDYAGKKPGASAHKESSTKDETTTSKSEDSGTKES